MNRLILAAAALAAGMTSFASNASEKERTIEALTAKVPVGEGQVDGQKTASIAGGAREAIGTAKTAKAAAAGRYADIIARHAAANGVPAGLARAVVRIESNFRANARGRAGEIGLMQIKHSTARAMGYGGSAKGLYDPETNIKYGMKYLGLARKLGDGSVCGTILKYNAGHGARRMNRISAAYCSKVKRYLEG